MPEDIVKKIDYAAVVTRFNIVLENITQHFEKKFYKFEDKTPLNINQAIGNGIEWYFSNAYFSTQKGPTVAYCPPGSYLHDINVPMVHTRVYDKELVTDMKEILKNSLKEAGLKPEEPFDHELWTKIDTDARLV